MSLIMEENDISDIENEDIEKAEKTNMKGKSTLKEAEESKDSSPNVRLNNRVSEYSQINQNINRKKSDQSYQGYQGIKNLKLRKLSVMSDNRFNKKNEEDLGLDMNSPILHDDSDSEPSEELKEIRILDEELLLFKYKYPKDIIKQIYISDFIPRLEGKYLKFKSW
eukprot:CAMPEP_0170538096 /NCGR_PEP_ID=MMETSP0209-20121228/103109_1 /TAXON_ID=665100 ORGANISM="Litonotus pictus, Strain P1" /NCGR_SAMPLE_ID=MMETSP0209 /ASSEMBLY_ACC=CAM_ASM_000301 /LENGTH=165 /DNA_ID=CAMNT_0010839723 /DNA_START=287 /DNA_END=781 /DNA_ORIENTATION=+